MAVSSPTSVISLPQGGGALHGLGEKFAPDLHTGTGNFSVPITLPQGRNGFQPQFELAYSTGNGNGPFGLGWSVSVPGITRKTSHGVPRYNELTASSETASDVFLLSGYEDLVRVSGNYPGRVRYRPRTEGLFARIEHVSEGTSNYWEVATKEGLITCYGTRPPTGTAGAGGDPAVIRDPNSDRVDRIFSWKLTKTLDPFGNLIVYEYLSDSGEGKGHRWNQPLLQRIKYADYGDPSNPSFLVQVKLVYEDRPDKSSTYRSGFEIRTTQRCNKILVSTHTADGATHPIREYDLIYGQDSHNGISLLSEIQTFGFDDAGVRSSEPILPPVVYGYTNFEPDKRRFKAVTGQALPLQSLSGRNIEFVDLHGNGLPDLIEMNEAVRYWRNLGNGQFDWPRTMANAPPHRLGDSGVRFIDANGDGRADLLVTAAPLNGYYPMTHAAAWDRKSFQPYFQAPSVRLEDPEVKLLDLDGDGITDLLRSGSRFECFFNDPNSRRSWQRTAYVERKSLDQFPDVNFSDPRIRLADMTGDGLRDIVAIHDGSVDYWPNLGHGVWGSRIRLSLLHRLPYGYDSQRVLLGDVDGDGLADLVYIDHGRVLLWINQTGNGWSREPIVISGTPPMTKSDTVRLIDLEGTGVSGLLWSRTAAGATSNHLKFLDFTGGNKPYLLNRVDNNMGAETRIEYLPSTHYYLRDRDDPKTRWQTSLPFPVQVVARVEVIDHLSHGKLTTGYRYHHGYWDGAEREFRGFGMVEQLDTETFEEFNAPGLRGPHVAFDNFSSPNRRTHFSPPKLTKTWFHQGPVGDEFGDWSELDYSREFWPGDPSALTRRGSSAEWLDRLPRRTKRDALRTLRGQVLRTELYAPDGTDRRDRPYTVTETINGVREEEQNFSLSHRRIFFPFPIAKRSTQWERGDEPLTQMSFTGDYDAYGQPGKVLAVAVPRARDYRVEATSAEPYLATLTETEHAQRNDAHVYMVDRVSRVSSHEVINDGKGTPFRLWEQVQAGRATLRPIRLGLRYYDGAPFVGLPYSQLGDYGVLMRSESLVLTEEILRQAYRSGDERPATADLPPYLDPNGAPVWTDEYPVEFRAEMPELAGYVYHREGLQYVSGYYVTTDRRRYDFQDTGVNGRGLATVSRDQFGHDATVKYDQHHLLPVEAVNPAGLKIAASYNYRLLQPESVTDPNGNTSRVTFTTSGLLDAIYVQGKNSQGDQNRPSTRFEYDLLAFAQQQPISVRTIRHVYHDTQTDVVETERDETIESIEYSDGFGRLLQTRAQAEDFLCGDPVFGEGLLPDDRAGAPGDTVARERLARDPINVIVSGWQVYDNKGRVVEKYEPFFSEGWSYTAPTDAQLGRKITMYYDARGQVVRTINPDNSEQIIIQGIPATLSDPMQFRPTPWELYTYDANDNAGRTHPAESGPYRHHWDTPQSLVVDALGRTVISVSRNGSEPNDWFSIHSTYDINGNLLSVTDALGRTTFKYSYDLEKRPLRTERLDGGVRRVILDAAGGSVEQRESSGSLILQGRDSLQRRTHLWARDNEMGRPTLRERAIFGDGAESGLAPDHVARLNLLGRPYKQYDEAGELIFGSYDFKGNVLEKARRTISDAVLLAPFASPPVDWQMSFARISWEAPAGTSLETYANTLLDIKSYRSSFSYDALNRIRELAYPENVEGARRNLRPRYNRAGALEGITLDDTAFVRHIAYNARGQRTLIAYANGCMTRHLHDRNTFRLTRMRTEKYAATAPLTFNPTSPTAPLQDLFYQYDLDGNTLSITDLTPESGFRNNPQSVQVRDPQLAQLLVAGNALLREFTYDPLYRLLSANGREHAAAPPDNPWDEAVKPPDMTLARGYTESYEYDPAGNLKQFSHRANGASFVRKFSLVAGTNRLDTLNVGATALTYSYDSSGNLVSETSTRHFEWDHSNRLRVFRNQVTGVQPSVYAQYLYDSQDQRVKKLVRKQDGSIEATVYVDGVFEHHYATQGGATSENNTLHVMDDQQRIALVRVGVAFAGDSSPAVQYQLADHLGSSNVVVNYAGDFVSREEYTPYGETSFGSFARKRYRFMGQERDEESGLAYHRARYYAPWLIRWICCDPAGAIEGNNLYGFVSGNPLRFTDRSGLYSQPISDENTTNTSPGTPASVTGTTFGTTLSTIGSALTDAYQSSTEAGAYATQYWASLSVEGEYEGGLAGALKQVLGTTAGVLSALWTPETALQTSMTLGTAGLGAAAHAGRLGIASLPVARTMAIVGSAQTGVSLGEAITGTHISGEPLSSTERVVKGG
ncbi:MAG TPA: SpvB/TcaC N-terminal domain-containing protein, partial [Pyrinomonadaceae bacterium]|nr:SpvB/TcaC N-terminal domain-containing protein [Pyrinomonadaceae bacterium]